MKRPASPAEEAPHRSAERTFAVYWIRRGGSISTLGRILGHRSFNTTMGFDPDQE